MSAARYCEGGTGKHSAKHVAPFDRDAEAERVVVVRVHALSVGEGHAL
jgi:hypothetical protein